MKTVIVLTATTLFSLVSGCDGSNSSRSTVSTDQQALDKSIMAWDTANITSYQFTYNSVSFIVPREDAIVTVVNRKVQSAYYAQSGTYLSPQELSAIPTIDDLFDKIQSALNNSYRLSVTYNAKLGYPETARIDPGIPDTGITYLVKSLQ